MTALPQHMRALERAEQQKVAKGNLTRSIRSLPPGASARKTAEVIETSHTDPVIGRVRLRYLLLAIPRMGDHNIGRCMRAAGIYGQTKRLNELTPRQRGAVVIQLEMWAERQAK